MEGHSVISAVFLLANIHLQVTNEVPRFQAFYARAARAGVSEQQRWALWKSMYGIAAVPPTPEGGALARRQLDEAWNRYAALSPRLPALTSEVLSLARTSIARIQRVLDVQSNATVRIVLFVGQFDNNAFSAPSMGGKPPTTVMPVEAQHQSVLLAHELTHAVHFAVDHIHNSFGAPLGETIFLEGLAMRSTAAVVPGLREADYAALSDTKWMDRCHKERRAVLEGVVPYLHTASADVATRFTFGKGTVGMQRQLYCAAWLVYGHLLDHGASLAKLARTPENSMPGKVASAISDMLRERH